VTSTNAGTGTYTVAAGSTLNMASDKIDALTAATGANAVASASLCAVLASGSRSQC
jgi:hypothetical protein